MTTTQQPEALRLAELLESDLCEFPTDQASSELRRLHSRVIELEMMHDHACLAVDAAKEHIAVLESQLEAIGAGGVESLRGAKPMSDLDIESLVLKHAPPIHPDFLDKDDHEELIRAVERFHKIGA